MYVSFSMEEKCVTSWVIFGIHCLIPVTRVCLLGVEASCCCCVKLNCIKFDFSANTAGQLTAASHLIAAGSSQVVSVKHMFLAQKVFMKLFMCTIFVTCKSINQFSINFNLNSHKLRKEKLNTFKYLQFTYRR